MKFSGFGEDLAEPSDARDFMLTTENETRNFITYAHRGASEYCPENTLLSFYTGVFMGANGIETDVQRTKDGVLVLYHDADLSRIGKTGSVADRTLEELQTFLVEKNGVTDRIPTVEDFFRLFGWRDLTFAIELKADGVGIETIDLIRKYGMTEKTVITSFSLPRLKEARAYDQNIRMGYLKKEITPEDESALLSLGIREVCPRGLQITAENVARWHSMGFNVRAWGISDTAVMEKVYDAGADGMTVNFPDKLLSYIERKIQ